MAFAPQTQPGLAIQPPQLISKAPMAQPQLIPTNSIKYQQQALPINFQQQQQLQFSGPTVQYAMPTQVHASVSPVQYQQTGPIQQIATRTTTVSGCPAPAYGQPIIIEGVMSGAQSYFGPKQTRLLQAHEVRPELSQVKLGATQTELIPYEQIITEYDQLERKIRIPYNKYITEYQIVEHQVEYHPEIAYQTETDFVPQQRVEEEVQYQTQEKRYETGWNRSMRTSQRIEGAIGITSTVPQQTIVQAAQPVVASSYAARTYAQPAVQTTYATSAIAAPAYGVATTYQQQPVAVQGYAQTQYVAQPGVQYIQANRKSSS